MRTENDTWDIQTGVGITAVWVAAARAAETARADAQINDPYAKQLAEGANPQIMQVFAEGNEFATHISNYIALRTRFFDDFFTRAAETGIAQAVILGSGLDTRPHRLTMPKRSFEIDQPAVLDYKNQVLRAAGAPIPEHHTQISIDLRQDWPKALVENGFSPQLPTAWIAEGLRPYLPTKSQEELLSSIDELSAPGSALAVEAFAHPSNLDISDLGIDVDELAKMTGTPSSIEDLFYEGENVDCSDWLSDRKWTVKSESPEEFASSREFPLKGQLIPILERTSFITATKN